MHIFLSTLIVFFCLSASLTAGVYKWTDEQGNVHYGDKPVSTKKATELKIDTESRAGITTSSGNIKERERITQELEEERKAREKTRDEQRVAKQERRARCKPLKKRLGKHLRANNVYKENAKGERTYYTEKEREEKIRKLRKEIAKACR